MPTTDKLFDWLIETPMNSLIWWFVPAILLANSVRLWWAAFTVNPRWQAIDGPVWPVAALMTVLGIAAFAAGFLTRRRRKRPHGERPSAD